MFKAAIRVNKITTIAQLRGATLHAEGSVFGSRLDLDEKGGAVVDGGARGQVIAVWPFQ